jgi:hypothetical protein
MNGSLPRNDDDLREVRLAGIQVLLEVMQASTVTSMATVRRRFFEQASSFESTLQLMQEIGWLSENCGTLLLAENAPLHDRLIRELLASRIVAGNGEYGAAARSYLQQFRVEADRIMYRPTAYTSGTESAVRNLLMDLHVVSYDAEQGEYRLEKKYVTLFADLTLKRRRISPEQAAAQERRREKLGTAAEKVVMDFERGRIGEKGASLIRHIAAEDISAGYDIESVTSVEGGFVPRLIEVKAVAGATHAFYWTNNEIEAAERLRGWYYLYLLPVLSSDTFDVNSIQLIQDPFRTVLKNPIDWSVKPDLYRCKRLDKMHDTEAGGFQ